MSDADTIMRYDALKKSAVIAYVLWWFLGTFGAHRFYLNQGGTAIAMLVITLVSVPLCLVFVGFIGLGIIGVWWIVDAFLIPGMLQEYNLKLARSLTPAGG